MMTTRIRCFTTALMLLVPVAALADDLGVASPPWQGASVLDDPEWRKSFLGSYGFLSQAEPPIEEGERELLTEVIDLMKVDPVAAAEMLQEGTGEGSSAALDFILANLYFQNDEQDEAITYYRSALEKFPDFRRAHKNLGLLLVQGGDFPGAREHLTRAVELGDRDGRSYGLMGFCYLNLDNNIAAEGAYRNAILHQPHVRDWKRGLARALLAMEKYSDAVGLFDTLISEDPSDATSWLLQANAYLGMEKPMAAAVNLEAVQMLGKAQSSSIVLLGDIYMNANMPELAKNAYLEVIERDEAAAQFQTAFRAAGLLVRVGDYGAAQEVVTSIDRRYKGLDNDEELDLLTLKAKLARAQKREKEAAGLLQIVVDRDGTRGDALLELGKYHSAQGNTEKALFLIERAENLEKYEYSALLAHAQILVSDRQYADAAKLLRRATEIKSEPRVVQYLARVEQAVRPE